MDESKAGSSPYGIFIYLELRKDSRVDFPFPLSSILDLLMNCFDPILVSSETLLRSEDTRGMYTNTV